MGFRQISLKTSKFLLLLGKTKSSICFNPSTNFNLCDLFLYRIVMEDPVLNLGTTAQESQLFSFSKYTVDLWTITHVHQIFSSVGCVTDCSCIETINPIYYFVFFFFFRSPVKQMNMTSHRQVHFTTFFLSFTFVRSDLLFIFNC